MRVARLLLSLRDLWLFLIIVVVAGCGGSATTSVSAPTLPKCGVSITNSPPEIPAAGGSGSLTLSTARDYGWSASSQDSWITLNTTSGQGEATVGYTVQSNPNGTVPIHDVTFDGGGKVHLLVLANDGPARSTVVTIAGQPFELRQGG